MLLAPPLVLVLVAVLLFLLLLAPSLVLVVVLLFLLVVVLLFLLLLLLLVLVQRPLQQCPSRIRGSAGMLDVRSLETRQRRDLTSDLLPGLTTAMQMTR